jgi:ubiquinone/menaquinone biosynthesis C-methylase UbiE
MIQVSPRQQKYDASNPVVRYLLGRFFARVAALARGAHPASVLDCGSGEGEMLRRGVLPDSVTPVCLDPRMPSLALIDGGAHRVCGSALDLPFASHSFDAVFCLEVLEHLDRPSEALAELARITRRTLIVSVPFEPWFTLGNLARAKHLATWGNHPEHIRHWNTRTFRRFLAQAFDDVHVEVAFPWIVARCHPRAHQQNG